MKKPHCISNFTKVQIAVFILVFQFIITATSVAQNIVLTGIVTDKGTPQKEVQITTIGGASKSAKTNEKGEYSIEVDTSTKALSFQFKQFTQPISAKIDRNISSFNFESTHAKGVWKWNGDVAFSFSNSLFSTYQSSGNNNNLSSMIGKLNFSATWTKRKYNWSNEFHAIYGQSHTTLRIVDNNKDISLKGVTAKSGDLLSFTSKFGERIAKGLYMTALTNFQSQFTAGYRDPYAEARGVPHVVISDFLAPANVNFGIGLDFKPTPNFSLYVSPCDFDMMVVRVAELREDFDVFSKNGIVPELGTFVSMTWNKNFTKKIRYNTKLQMFTNYIKNNKHPNAERPGSIDIQLWQHNLVYQINKYFSVSFAATVKYDEDLHFLIYQGNAKDGKTAGYKAPRTQYFQNLGFSIGYNVANKPKM
jgi:hypothetical protein